MFRKPKNFKCRSGSVSICFKSRSGYMSRSFSSYTWFRTGSYYRSCSFSWSRAGHLSGARSGSK